MSKGDRNRNPARLQVIALYVYPIARTITRGAVLVALFYYAYRSISVLAGKATTAMIELVFSIASKSAIALLIGGLAYAGVAFGVLQFKIRQSRSKRLQERIEKLEREIDPERRSENHKGGG